MPELPYEASRFQPLALSGQRDARGERWLQTTEEGMAVWWLPPAGLEAAPRREPIQEWVACGFAVPGPPPDWRGADALLEVLPATVAVKIRDQQRLLQLSVNLSP